MNWNLNRSSASVINKQLTAENDDKAMAKASTSSTKKMSLEGPRRSNVAELTQQDAEFKITCSSFSPFFFFINQAHLMMRFFIVGPCQSIAQNLKTEKPDNLVDHSCLEPFRRKTAPVLIVLWRQSGWCCSREVNVISKLNFFFLNLAFWTLCRYVIFYLNKRWTFK